MYQGQIEATAGPFDLVGKRASPNFALRGKRLFDLTAACIGLALTAVFAVVLLALNPLFNPGPIFFQQKRMGKDGVCFTMWKFRTMSVSGNGMSARPVLSPLETHRITPFGQFLRKFRIDELPNFINVLRGEMSVIGPRPDAWDHARQFCVTVPFYSDRFRVLPGITGLAQIRSGYAECLDGMRRKARFDYHYVSGGGWKMELYIIWKTILVILTRCGAK